MGVSSYGLRVLPQSWSECHFDLTEADLTNEVLFYMDLSGANLSDVDLSGANLTGANLTDIFYSSKPPEGWPDSIPLPPSRDPSYER